MKKKPVFVAVSNQKGGVGKSTMLVALASLLNYTICLLYTSPRPRDYAASRMPSSA